MHPPGGDTYSLMLSTRLARARSQVSGFSSTLQTVSRFPLGAAGSRDVGELPVTPPRTSPGVEHKGQGAVAEGAQAGKRFGRLVFSTLFRAHHGCPGWALGLPWSQQAFPGKGSG